jgi:hypothetical protein
VALVLFLLIVCAPVLLFGALAVLFTRRQPSDETPDDLRRADDGDPDPFNSGSIYDAAARGARGRRWRR